MMRNKHIVLLLIIALTSCTTDEELYVEMEPTEVMWVPSNFPPFIDVPENPMTESGVNLGKKLFFDQKLSGNNAISCATCHVPELAFSDGLALSTKGISGKMLFRHVPTLINLAWADNGLFWDGGSRNLESQAFAPFAHEDEMFQDLEDLERKLKDDKDYPRRFQDAFSQEITANLVMKALAQFQRSLVSAQSKYDRVMRKERNASFNKTEKRGMLLFEEKCAQCHTPALFTDNEYHNNGLDAQFNDFSEEELFLGRYRVTRDPADLGKYKTPTLRNVAVSAPYMHDGRIESLEEVLNFYDDGVQDSQSLDPLLKQNNKLGIALSDEDKDALIAFMHTLTDYNFLNDERFAEY